MKDKKAFLQTMLKSCDTIISYTSTLEFIDFINDTKTFDATIMQLIHLGETTKKLYDNFGNIKELPIQEMIGMRNFIAHNYLGISYKIIYNVAIIEIPKIQKTLKNLIS